MAEGHGGARPGSGRWSKDELEALKRGDSDDLVSRIKGRSFASIRAKRAELKRKPKETEKTDLEKIAAEPKKAAGTSLAMARVIEASKALKAQESRRHELNPFQVAQHPPRATPPKKYQMAMDQSVGWASNAWLGEVGGVLASAGAEGLFFLGYPFLAELAQRSEYRVISETIADDATRKWIDFEVTGSETEKEPSIEDPEEMREAGALDKSPEAVEAENALESKTRGFKDEDPDERKKKIESAGKMDKVKALKDEMARLELRDRFYNISRDDGFFGRSHLFMDFGVDLDDNRGELGHDIGDGRNKTTQGKIEKGSLKRLKVIEPVWIYPTTYNATNPLKEDWYNPQIWYVMGKMVHASRMPTFVGHPVPDLLKPAYSFGGLALSQMAKPYVDIWLTTRESIGSLIHSFSVMCLETDMQTALQGSGFDNVMMRVAMFNALRDNQGTFVTNKNTEGFKNVSAPLSGLHELQAQAQEHMASVSRIPLVKLTGISPSGLNASSEGEIRAYYDTIAAYQNRFFRPHLTKVLNFMQLSLWGEIDPEITFEFEPLWEMSQKEKSEKEKDDATRDQTYVDIGAFSPGEIRKIKIDDPTLPYTDMDPEDVPDLREEEEQGLEPQGGRPQPLAEAGPELGEGGIEPSGRGQDESPERSGLAWNDQYEWMRGYDLPTTRRDGAVIVKEAPQGSIARGKGLRVGSRVRLADGSTGRVFGFVQNAGGDSGVSVAVLDTERDRVVFPAEEAVSTRPVAAEDEWRGGGQDASLVPFGRDVDPLFESLAGDVEFEEGDHPRGEGGKFKSKGGEKDGSTAAKAIPPQETPSSGWWKTYQAKKTEGGKFQAPQLGLPYGAAAQPSSWVSGGAAPEPPRPPLDPKKLKRVGEQMGSNPGGVFEDESGKRYYVKQGKSAEHVKNELLAAALYKLAGTPLLKYRAVEGGKHIATEMAKLDKDNANKLSPSEIKEARKDFVPHAWLANWDAAGLGGDNLGTVKGVPTALDLGGSLAYRAQGAPKGEAFGTKVGELDSLRDPKVNKDTAKIFGEMTPSEMRESASYVTNVRDSDIKRAVKEAGVDASMADKLIARKNDIAQRAKTFGAEGKPDKPTSTVIFPAGDELPVKELNGVAFKPWRPPADWAGVEGQNESLEEPPLDTKGKQASSGLIMREPDGRVWMVRPKGGFGGYEHTFSKGRVDKGLSLQANAIKETWEESGLKGKIVGFAGDHEGDTTMTRYYLAEREGGDPSQHDQETDGVVLAPPNKLSGFLNRKRDQDIAKSLGGDQALDEDGASGFSHIDRSFETSLEDRDETKLDKLGYLQGLKKIKMEPDHDQWNSRYDGEKDEIVLEGKFEDLDDQEKMRTLLHEAGHRGQLLADTEGFEEFKKRGLAKEEFFVEMANKTHMEDFERRGVVDGEAGEVFAESYARFCLGMDLPEVLAEFWSEREKALETDTALDAEFKESDDGAMDEFEESEHPRGEGGKFASKGGSEQTKTFKNFTPSTSSSHHLSQVEKVLASPSKSGTTFRWMVNMLIKEIPKFPASASPEMAKLRAQSLRMKIAMSWDKERMKAKAKGDDALVQKITQKMKKLGWTGEPSPTPAKEAPKTSAEIMEKVKTASQEPATAQELEKAKKTVALQVQYVPGHEYAPSDAVEKLVEAFNKKYAGKEMTSEQALKTKVGDFKALKTAVAEMGAKTKAEQEKVQAENAVKQQAAAAKQAAEQAEQLKKQAQAEKEKAAKIHAENKEFMDALGISEAEAEGVKGLLKMLGAGTTTSLADFKKEAASSVKHLGHNMTGIEAALISKYKHGSSFVNEEMRKPMASWDESVVAAAKVLNKALSKLPAYKEVTVRNTPLSKDIQMRYQPGKVVMEHGFTGTSKKKPHGVFSGNTRFYVTPKAGGGRGKDISAMFGFHGEEEVLYQAHTMFRVDKVEGSPGGSGNASYSVYMTEVEY